VPAFSAASISFLDSASEPEAVGGQDSVTDERSQHSFAPALIDAEQTRGLPNGQGESGQFAKLALNAGVEISFVRGRRNSLRTVCAI
jgi:hypothetical protein